MEQQENGLLRFPFLGIVAKDKTENGFDIEVYPMEIMPNYSGDINAINNVNTSNVNSIGENTNIIVNKDRKVKCTWIPLFDTANRVSPPSVKAGETVLVVCVGNLDKYFWSASIFPDSDLRTLENRVIYLSNKQQLGQTDLSKGYYNVMDTYNKFLKIHTSNNDGEYTTYDMELRTKDGLLKIWDGLNNYIELDSQKNTLTINTNNELKIVTTNTVRVQTKNTIIESSETVDVKTKTAKVNASESVTVETKTANINASSSATIKTKSCTIDSTNCQIN